MKKLVFISSLFFFFMLLSSVQAQLLLDENFEGSFPPTGWGVVNYGGECVWSTTNAVGRTDYTAPANIAATADSDMCGSGTITDTSLRTPVLDLSPYTTASLDFIACYRDLGTAYDDEFSIWISLDGGITWEPTSLLYWNENHSYEGPGEAVNIDLSAYTGAGFNNIMLDFYYYGSWDWYVQIDDLTLGASAWIDLLSFDGSISSRGITLGWETGAEIDCLGFNLLRMKQLQDGSFSMPMQINKAVIPAEGSAHSGASYKFFDSKATPGYYRYILEEVTMSGSEYQAGTTDVDFRRVIMRE